MLPFIILLSLWQVRMATMMLIEAILVCVLALPVGWLALHARDGDRASGAARSTVKRLRHLATFVLFIVLAVAFSGLLFWFFAWRDILPLQHLPATLWRYDLDCLGAAVLVSEVLLWLVLPVGALAYLMGGLPSMAFVLLTMVLLEGGSLFLAALAGNIHWMGLDVLVTGVGVWFLGLAGARAILWQGRAKPKASLVWGWTAFFILCLLVAFTIGRLGVLLIFLPAVLAFFMALFVFAGLVLPISTAQERWDAFRSLLTCALGTNFPFYVIEDWHTRERREDTLPAPRVAGDPFRRFFSGPGIVLNDVNHAAVLWDGVHYRIAPPGLSFTGPFEQLFAAVDLRPQLRTTTIEAETADGITTNTLVFMPQRIEAGQQTLQLGKAYPYNEKALLRAVCDHAYVQHHFGRDTENLAEEKLERISWESLSQMLAPPILRDLILARKCDALHASGTARVEIATEFVHRLREQLAAVGVDLVAGGLSNITVPRDVVDQRIVNWEAKWKGEIELQLGQEEAEIAAKLDPIWAQAQLEVYADLAKILKQAGELDLDLDVVALQLVDALGAMPLKEKNVQDLPTFMWAMMRHGRAQEGER